jgi:hypothetical protein
MRYIFAVSAITVTLQADTLHPVAERGGITRTKQFMAWDIKKGRIARDDRRDKGI